eukprot:7418192-Pyramimonas_sp.AAC.1
MRSMIGHTLYYILLLPSTPTLCQVFTSKGHEGVEVAGGQLRSVVAPCLLVLHTGGVTAPASAVQE